MLPRISRHVCLSDANCFWGAACLASAATLTGSSDFGVEYGVGTPVARNIRLGLASDAYWFSWDPGGEEHSEAVVGWVALASAPAPFT